MTQIKSAPRARWKIKLALVTGAVVVALAVSGAVFKRANQDGRSIRVSGNIEITRAEISSKIPGRLAARLVDEGQPVRAGDVVARLESAELEQVRAARQADVQAAEAQVRELEAGARPQEIQQAKSAVAAAQAALDEALAWSRPQEIATADAEVSLAKADADRLSNDLARYTRLHEQKIISQQQFDAARTAADVARARLKSAQEKSSLIHAGARKEKVEQARAALEQTQERYRLIEEGPRKETIDQARAKLAQTQAALGVAEVQLGYTAIVSPLDGMTLSKSTEPGEFVSPGTPIVTVGDLAHTWVRAYIQENDLGRVKLGQAVTITTDTYPGKTYTGAISFIAPQAEFTPKNVQTYQERVKLVYRVKIDVPNPEDELKPGMPVDGVIQTP